MGCGIVKLVPVPDLTVVESFQGRAAGDYQMERDFGTCRRSGSSTSATLYTSGSITQAAPAASAFF